MSNKNKQEKQRERLLELFETMPIVQVACKRIGIGRATYYRWRQEDHTFALAADEALENGKLVVNDMAESQIIQGIKNSNPTLIIFWLKNNHPNYDQRKEKIVQQKGGFAEALLAAYEVLGIDYTKGKKPKDKLD